MSMCKKCNRDIRSVNEDVLRTEYAVQADYWLKEDGVYVMIDNHKVLKEQIV